RSRLPGERERARERRLRLEGDHVARLRRVEGRLEVPPRRDGDGASRRWAVRRVDLEAGELRLGRAARRPRDRGEEQRDDDRGQPETPPAPPSAPKACARHRVSSAEHAPPPPLPTNRGKGGV